MRIAQAIKRGDARPHRRWVEGCVVLEWGAPWKRTTHKFYPAEVRARVVVLMRVAQAIKRGKAAYEADGVFVAFASPAAVADVFESCVIPHLIASEMW